MSTEQTPAQFIADTLCQREGKKKNLPTPPKYWSQPEWKVKYKKYILMANSLLKVYPFEVITEVLNKNKWIYSLWTDFAKQALEEESARFERKEEISKNNKAKVREVVVSTNEAPTILDNNQSLRNRLD